MSSRCAPIFSSRKLPSQKTRHCVKRFRISPAARTAPAPRGLSPQHPAGSPSFVDRTAPRMAPATDGHPVGLPFPARLGSPELLTWNQTARRVPERTGLFHHGRGTHFGGVVNAPATAQDASAPKQGRERSFLKTRRRNEQARQPRPGTPSRNISQNSKTQKSRMNKTFPLFNPSTLKPFNPFNP